jgi:hypothetical protein
MGIVPLPLVLTLLSAVTPTASPQPWSDARFQDLLVSGTITTMEQACLDPMAAGTKLRKQQLRDRLLAIHPVPASFDLTMRNAGALLTCGAPEGTALVLNRFSPARGDERRRWLMLRWQAAAAALDHRQAALALRRLVDGNVAALDDITLAGPRNGLDTLAEHEASRGRPQSAALVLLQGDLQGAAGARRRGRAAEWLAATDPEQADQLLEVALDEAASVQAWGLAMELLQLQLRLQLAAGGDGERPRRRIERLAARLDDAYTQLQLNPESTPPPSLRSPREPGGHAAVGEPTTAPSL